MSGRVGGRGGRGGRWFGRGGGSVTHDLIRDNLEDLGIDHFQPEDKAPPPLYPATELPYPSLPKQFDLYAIEKNREIVHRLQNSDYYLTRNYTSSSDNKGKPSNRDKAGQISKNNNVDVDVDFLQGIQRNTVPVEWQKYVPAELFESTSKQKSKGPQDLNFQNLEAAEKSTGNRNPASTTVESKEEGSGNENEEIEEEMEDIEDDDYIVDHYASDNDLDDGGGGDGGDEAVF